MKRAWLSLLCAAVLLVLFCLPVVAAASAEIQPVTVRIEVGYSEGRLYVDKQMPVRVTLHNRTRSPVSGTFVLTPSDGYGPASAEPAFIETAASFSLGGNEERTVEIPLTALGTTANGISCRVLDTGGREIASNTLAFDDWHLSKALLVGWLTCRQDDAFVFEKLNGLKITGPETAVEHISADRFPGSLSLIDSFDVILCGDLDFGEDSPFSESQKRLLVDYLRAGGRVIAGTGTHGAGTLAAFREFFTEDPSGSCVYEGERFTFERNIGGTGGRIISFRDVPASSFAEEFAVTVRSPLYLTSDSVCLMATPFSLTDQSVADSTDNQSFIVSQCVSYVWITPNGKSVAGGDPAVSSVNADARFLVSDTRDRTPSGSAILAGVVLYSAAGIVLPVAVLRKKSREKLIPVVICASAALFSVLFTGYGRLVRGGTAVYTLNTVRLSESGLSRAALLTGVYSPRREDLELSFEGDGSVAAGLSQRNLCGSGQLRIPDTLPSRVTYDGRVSVTYAAEKDKRLVNYAEYVSDGYAGLSITAFAKARQNGQAAVIFPFYDTVRIENLTGRDLSDAFLFRQGYYFRIGDIPAGETVQIDISAWVDGVSSLAQYLFSSDASYASKYDPAAVAESQAGSLADLLVDSFYRDLPAAEARDEAERTVKGFGLGGTAEYRAYYYNTSLSVGGPFPSLRGNESDFRKAWVTSCAGTLCDLDGLNGGNAILFGAFDDGAPDMTPLVNGKKAASRFSLTFVYFIIS